MVSPRDFGRRVRKNAYGLGRLQRTVRSKAGSEKVRGDQGIQDEELFPRPNRLRRVFVSRFTFRECLRRPRVVRESTGGGPAGLEWSVVRATFHGRTFQKFGASASLHAISRAKIRTKEDEFDDPLDRAVADLARRVMNHGGNHAVPEPQTFRPHAILFENRFILREHPQHGRTQPRQRMWTRPGFGDPDRAGGRHMLKVDNGRPDDRSNRAGHLWARAQRPAASGRMLQKVRTITTPWRRSFRRPQTSTEPWSVTPLIARQNTGSCLHFYEENE